MQTSQSLHQQLHSARANTDALLGLVHPDALYDRPIPERHRIIFYLGHLEAFDWNQIGRFHLGHNSFHPTFDTLFEAGIDPEPGKAPSDQPADWPGVREICTYNAQARQRVDSLWNDVPPDLQQLALEHRLMHAETFAYILHNQVYHRKFRAPEAEVSTLPAPPNRMIEIPAGAATLGQQGSEFGWDNEFPQVQRQVNGFAVDKYKVTNGDYLEFVRAGAKPPHFWLQKDGEWFLRGMFEEIPLPLDWPVYVMQEEAQAYANFRGKALPTEELLPRAAFGRPNDSGSQVSAPNGSKGNHSSGNGSGSVPGNLDFRRWDPVPVHATPDADSPFGVSQLIGNGWEWTSTPFAPFAGFEPRPSYPGYSANFFDGKHYVLKGASPRTAASLTRPSLRNWFRPNYPYLYASFRLVDN